MADRSMIVAGIGCRRTCPADPIVALVREAATRLGHPVDALAAPESKRHEPGLHEAAAQLGLPLHFVPRAALEAAQPSCPTRSAAARRATGLASVAEAAALAAANGQLLLPRFGAGPATCAVAGPA